MSGLLLTDARRSVWDAIHNWQRTDNGEPLVFNKEFTFDEEMPNLEDITPSLADLPALSVFPSGVQAEWQLNQLQYWPYTLDFALWTQDWVVVEPETLFEQIIRALWKAHPVESTVTYVKRATGYFPVSFSPMTMQRARLEDIEGPKVILSNWSVVLRLNMNPLS